MVYIVNMPRRASHTHRQGMWAGPPQTRKSMSEEKTDSIDCASVCVHAHVCTHALGFIQFIQ